MSILDHVRDCGSPLGLEGGGDGTGGDSADAAECDIFNFDCGDDVPQQGALARGGASPRRGAKAAKARGPSRPQPGPQPGPQLGPQPGPKGSSQAGHLVAVVGGVEYAFGGWGEYEAVRRRAVHESEAAMIPSALYILKGAREKGGSSSHARAFYAGKAVIGGREAAESLLSAHPPRALIAAARHLARSLGGLEDSLCDPDETGVWSCESPAALLSGRSIPEEPASPKGVTIPTLTSADVESFVDGAEYTSPDNLFAIANDAIATAAALRVPIESPPALHASHTRWSAAIPPLPARIVATDGVNAASAIQKIETAAIPYVSRVEELQCAVAGILDRTATAIDGALKTVGRHR